MKCGNCVYYEDDVCYKKGSRVGMNNSICENFIKQKKDIDRNGLQMDLIK